MARLERSLAELRIARPMTAAALAVVHARDDCAQPRARRHRLCRRSRAASRAAISRFRPPARGPRWSSPRAATISPRIEQLAADGVAVVTVPDIRWGRVDIKSVALLPNVLAKQAAREQGAREAWLVDGDGRVTEGASSNAWIVARDGKIVTHPLGHDILPGITRAVVLDVIKAQGLAFEERAFTLEEAYAAREAFITSASQIVMPVVAHRRPPGRQRRARPDRGRLAARLSPPRRSLVRPPRIGNNR